MVTMIPPDNITIKKNVPPDVRGTDSIFLLLLVSLMVLAPLA